MSALAPMSYRAATPVAASPLPNMSLGPFSRASNIFSNLLTYAFLSFVFPSYQLAVLNVGINPQCTNLVPGETLCLGNADEDCSDTYAVQSDDTCESISEHSGVPLDMIFLNNPEIDDDCSNLYVGQVSHIHPSFTFRSDRNNPTSSLGPLRRDNTHSPRRPRRPRCPHSEP